MDVDLVLRRLESVKVQEVESQRIYGYENYELNLNEWDVLSLARNILLEGCIRLLCTQE